MRYERDCWRLQIYHEALTLDLPRHQLVMLRAQISHKNLHKRKQVVIEFLIVY